MKKREDQRKLWEELRRVATIDHLVRVIARAPLPEIREEAWEMFISPSCRSQITRQHLSYLVIHSSQFRKKAAEMLLSRRGRGAATNYHLRVIIQHVPSLKGKAAERLLRRKIVTDEDLECIIKYVPELNKEAEARRQRSPQFLLEELTGVFFERLI